MPGISYTSATIIGAFLECVVYGIFVSLLIATFYVQWMKFKGGRGVNRLIASATVFFGLTVTVHLVISLRRVLRAILYNPPGAPVKLSAGPPTHVDGVVAFALLHLQTAVADVVVAYRMYHIYDESLLVCIIPSITITAWFIVGCYFIHVLLDPAESPRAEKGWPAAAFWLGIFNIVFLTGAISYKLWRVNREARRTGLRTDSSIVVRAMRVLIESAALWTTFSAINYFFRLNENSKEMTLVFVQMSSPILGISFCLIVVRLGRALPGPRPDTTWRASTHTPATPARPSVAISFPRIEIQREVYVDESKDFPMESLGSQKQGYVSSSDDLPKIFQHSLPPSHPV